MFKWVANMHGNEAVGRQMVMFMAKYLLVNYGKDSRVTGLVDTTDLWLMPSMNPDGFAAAVEGDCGEEEDGGRGREGAQTLTARGLKKQKKRSFTKPKVVCVLRFRDVDVTTLQSQHLF